MSMASDEISPTNDKDFNQNQGMNDVGPVYEYYYDRTSNTFQHYHQEYILLLSLISNRTLGTF